MSLKNVWLDVDPGHDDATAIMLAIHCEKIHLLGISTTHGNTDSKCTAINAARCLVAFGAPSNVLVYPGASKPLILPTKHDPEIHGPDGLGGAKGLPNVDDPAVLARIATDSDGTSANALEGMSRHIKEAWGGGSGSKVTIVSSGPMTNIALFVAVYPNLLVAVEEFVFMGGGVGLGNRSAVAEFNILCDPHAAQIVLDAPVPVVMIPINVTHTAIVTREVHSQLLSPGSQVAEANLPPASSNLRHTLSTLMSFFTEAYKSTFGFNLGPPLHDALTVAYVAYPTLFRSKRYRVDVELAPSHTIGETVVDVWNYRRCSDDTWGVDGKNCLVIESLNVAEFFNFFLACVTRCDDVSPLNLKA
ncbi:nucleoside hydrolase [Marasmius fiardii PR-910]|nr:nucleoside hydrolase [Marasmius fiardii PR-910]